MARITVEDCQERVENRFLLVQMTIKRVYQYREGYESLVDSRNKEVVTALREIAAGKILPEDLSYFRPADGTTRHIAAYDDGSYETDDYIVEVPDISADNARLAQMNAMNLAAYDREEDEADEDEDDEAKAFDVQSPDALSYGNNSCDSNVYADSFGEQQVSTVRDAYSGFDSNEYVSSEYEARSFQPDSDDSDALAADDEEENVQNERKFNFFDAEVNEEHESRVFDDFQDDIHDDVSDQDNDDNF